MFSPILIQNWREINIDDNNLCLCGQHPHLKVDFAFKPEARFFQGEHLLQTSLATELYLGSHRVGALVLSRDQHVFLRGFRWLSMGWIGVHFGEE